MRVVCILFRDEGKNENFAESCYRFTPDIALRGQEAIFLDIGKCQRLYSEALVVSRLKALLARFGRKATIALADDVPAALASAHSGGNSVRDQLPLAFLDDYLDPFAVDPETKKNTATICELLSALGIRTLGDFRRVPVRGLVSRFGGTVETAWLRLNNPQVARSLPWPRWKVPEKIREERVFLETEYCANLEPLLFLLRDPLDRCMARLRGRSLRAQTLRIQFELEKHSFVREPRREWKLALYAPQGTAASLLPLIRERLQAELARQPLESLVLALTVEVTETAPGFSGQRNFFHEREEKEEAWNGLMGRLAAKLGRERVFHARTTERYLPEHSWARTRAGAEEVPLPYGSRPLRLLTPARALHRVGRFLLEGGKRWRITEVDGPERIKGEWWSDPVERDYYRIETLGGEALWIYRDSRGGLFLHGMFE